MDFLNTNKECVENDVFNKLNIPMPEEKQEHSFVRVKGTDVLVKNYLDAIRIHVWFYEDQCYEKSKRWFKIAMEMTDCPYRKELRI